MKLTDLVTLDPVILTPTTELPETPAWGGGDCSCGAAHGKGSGGACECGTESGGGAAV